MKFLILAALAAVAVADYHDDTFHFSTLGSATTLSGLSGLRQAKQYTVQTASPVYSTASYTAQPAYTQQYATYTAQPAFARQAKQYTAISSPAYTTTYTAQTASPAYSTATYTAQPAFARQAKEYTTYTAQPTYTQEYTTVQTAQPAYARQAKQYSSFSALPAYTQKYSALKVAQPAYSQQYSAVKELAAPAVYAQQYTSGPQVRILSQVQEADPAGPYKLSYATENGIQVSEQGALTSGAEGAVVAAQGSYSHTGPDGQVYTVNWIADENGYRASGDHLPVPPPVPAEILKSLEEIARSGNKYDEEGRPFRK